MQPSKKLIKNLNQAAEALRQLGKHQDLMSHYDSAEALAGFIESQIPLLTGGVISQEDVEELWLIFAPTSEWDDYIGDVNLAESIFQELKSLQKK